VAVLLHAAVCWSFVALLFFAVQRGTPRNPRRPEPTKPLPKGGSPSLSTPALPAGLTLKEYTRKVGEEIAANLRRKTLEQLSHKERSRRIAEERVANLRRGSIEGWPTS